MAQKLLYANVYLEYSNKYNFLAGGEGMPEEEKNISIVESDFKQVICQAGASAAVWSIGRSQLKGCCL
ncbi:hypothetical protein [Alicyclobacillus fastidiosus]|uniref:Uncharacterized protein n=1 Tax=Alicyclobacillus fastidiosus TaxID=392011 RepID=A0ABV5ALU9_9BACL|nr:hypothetical protein [Alicyclobacillus fastidiosus]WEH10206.1 hypothetical protein PYS47_02875 [Alicyclobacillus fastidiosus]